MRSKKDIRLEVPDMGPKKIVSRQYKIYQEEERIASIPQTIYEKACRFSNKVINIEPDAETGKKLQSAIEFSHMNVTPNGVASLTILGALLICLPILFLIILTELFSIPILSFGNGILILLVAFPFVYYVYTYPMKMKKRFEIQIGSEMVSMILYMAMYMRNVPNIEGAINFASKNVTGPLALELRKMMWDLEIRKYVSIYDALMTYTKKWEKNREFVDAVEILVTSQQQAGKRRLEMLDEAVQVILEGYREQSRHFNQKLKLPVAVVHALGILLPVLGLVLFPIVAVFLNVKAIVLFVGYNIILPFILLFVISNILETRPVTYSKIDISENPDVPPKGKFRFKNKDLPAWPFGFVVGAVVFIIGLVVFLIEGTGGVLSPVLMTGSVAFGVSVYYILLSRKRLQVRQETREIEDEFAEALFQIGSQVQSGAPVEMSLEMSLKRIGNMKIKKMFNVALKNIRTLGMTFDQAFFDKKYGAVYFFPSKLIKSVIHTVVETTKKGVSVASLAMLSVSKYLKGIHETQEEVQEGLSDTVNSLKFQSFFLSPFISGVIVTMAIVIIQILGELSIRLGDSSLGGGVAGVPFGIPFGQISITPFEFVIIVAIYMIESSFILSYFINGIENGDDPIGRQDTTAYTLLIGFIVFSLSLFITLGIFGPLIIGSFA